MLSVSDLEEDLSADNMDRVVNSDVVAGLGDDEEDDSESDDDGFGVCFVWGDERLTCWYI